MTDTSLFDPMPRGFDFGQAVAEASRCLLCHDPPCSAACPGETDPGRFIRQLRLRNITGAIRTIKQNNILGGACGHLCPTAELCELECAATDIDRPIQIGKLQRFLVEHSWAIDFHPLEAGEPRPEKVALVGSGPASLSCAAELAKAGVQATIFEALPAAGGALRFGVPSYRFDDAFLDHEIQDLVDLGVELVFNHRIEGPGEAEALLEQGYDAVFLAPGCWKSMRVDSPVEPFEGLTTAMDFLADLRLGRSDQWRQAIEGEQVVVVGGGSVAMDCAGAAVRLGARDVYLLYRRSYTQMPAEEAERIESLQLGVQFLLLNQPVGYVQHEDGRLAGVRVVRTRLGEEDDSGRRRPVSIEGSEWVLDCDVCIEAIGQRPDPENARTYPSVETRWGGLVRAEVEDCCTSVPGIFAGGDVVRGPALIIQAVQDGKVAARSILKFLDE